MKGREIMMLQLDALKETACLYSFPINNGKDQEFNKLAESLGISKDHKDVFYGYVKEFLTPGTEEGIYWDADFLRNIQLRFYSFFAPILFSVFPVCRFVIDPAQEEDTVIVCLKGNKVVFEDSIPWWGLSWENVDELFQYLESIYKRVSIKDEIRYIGKRELLLRQLESFKKQRYEDDAGYEETAFTKEMAEYFNIPEEYKNVFVPFANEYLKNPNGIIAEDGPFFYDDDFFLEVKEKMNLFYQPIIQAITGNNYYIVIEPSYSDRTTMVAISDKKVIFKTTMYVRDLWFNKEDLLNHLEETYNSIVAELQI